MTWIIRKQENATSSDIYSGCRRMSGPERQGTGIIIFTDAGKNNDYEKAADNFDGIACIGLRK